jgi:hypothetical protein
MFIFTATIVYISSSCQKDLDFIETTENNNPTNPEYASYLVAHANGHIYCYTPSGYVHCGYYMRSFWSWFGDCYGYSGNCLPQVDVTPSVAGSYYPIWQDDTDSVFIEADSLPIEYVNSWGSALTYAVSNNDIINFIQDEALNTILKFPSYIIDDIINKETTIKSFHNQNFLVNFYGESEDDDPGYDFDYFFY